MSEQPYLGTEFEPPGRNVDIERAIAKWKEAQREQKHASQATRDAHAAMVLHIENAGLVRYPYVNPDTGKKRDIVVEREPKAKEAKSAKAGRREGDAEVADPDEAREKNRERKKRREEEKVEVRRVSRSSVEDEVDPFAATRNAMASSSSSAKTKHDKPGRARGKPAKPKGKRN